MISPSIQNLSSVRILYIIGFLQGLAISCTVVIVNLYMKSLGSSILLIALSNALFFIPRGIFHFISGKISDRVGSPLLIIFSLIIFAIDALAYFLSSNPFQLTVSRIIQGFAAGFFWAPIYSAVSRAVNREGQARAIARFTFSSSFGLMFGSNLGGWLAQNFEPPAAAVGGLIFFISAILFSSLLKEKIRVMGESMIEVFPTTQGNELVSMFSICIIASTLVPLGYVLNGLGMNLHVDSLGGDYILIGNIAALSTLASLVFTILAPRILTFLKISFTLFVFILLTGLITLTLTLVKILSFDFILFPALAAVVAIQRVVWMRLIQSLAGKQNVGVGTGLYLAIMDLFSIGYFLLLGIIAEYQDLGSMFLVSAIIPLILAFLTKHFLKKPFFIS